MGRNDKTKFSTRQLLHGLIANLINLFWSEMILWRERLNDVVSMNFSLILLLSVMAKIVKRIVANEIFLIHLRHLFVTGKIQKISHAVVRHQGKILSFFRIEDILDKFSAVTLAVNGKCLVMTMKIPQLLSLQIKFLINFFYQFTNSLFQVL